MHSISYGLFLVTAKGEKGDNGCIINTVMQVTSNPLQILVSINKQNLTHDLVKNSATLCVSTLSEKTPFSVFNKYGFVSGRTENKFKDSNYPRDGAGNIYLNDYACAYVSGKVVAAHDYGSHTVFVAEVVEGDTLSSEPPVTYKYYLENIKPKPEAKSGWVCKVCSYVYEGDTLPEGFVCPLCKHGADDFEKI